mmetsp:Transcript_31414/g.104165  ORF Transcript_31414/g.104165 Transcript_31414/m.104165 type:complete len:110 (-) Transcript_31414:23-352(-)
MVGQRVATVLVYLNDLPDGCLGGATRFTQLGGRGPGGDIGQEGLRVRPRRGAAVAWPNVGLGGAPLFETEHEAEPLELPIAHCCGGEAPRKVAMNIWIRDRPVPWATVQ